MSIHENPRIVVINHRSANIHSVDKALRRVGANAIVSSSARDLESADGAVLPGVGSSDPALRALDELGLTEPTRAFARSGRPLLGVCLGMQLMFDRSEEGTLPGLGLIPGSVVRFPGTAGDDGGMRLKIPHMGWNRVQLESAANRRHPIFRNIPQGQHFYFVHSFICQPAEPQDVQARTEYGVSFVSAVARGEIVATQFHPEKSQALGLRLYENFVHRVEEIARGVPS